MCRSDSEMSKAIKVGMFCVVFLELLLVKTRLLKFDLGVQKLLRRVLIPANQTIQARTTSAMMVYGFRNLIQLQNSVF